MRVITSHLIPLKTDNKIKDTHVVAILLAAGSGTRMGRVKEKSKVLINLETSYGSSITPLELCVSKFQSSGLVDHIIVVGNDIVKEFIAKKQFLSEAILYTDGGSSRSASVRSGLKYIKTNFGARCTHVLIHDAARCLFHVDLVTNCVNYVIKESAVTSACRIYDSLIRSSSASGEDSSNKIKEYIPRDNVWSVQTPQAFSFELIQKAHEGEPEGTDDASLVAARAGINVAIVESSSSNIKLTTQQDIKKAIAILSSNYV